MSQNSFLRLLREYAALSRRLSVTYWAAVDTLCDSRVASIEKEARSEKEIRLEIEQLSEIVDREYPFARGMNEATRPNKV